MNKNYQKIIEALGEVIINKDVELKDLKKQNEQLKKSIDKILSHVDSYVNS